ncbi:hypothetical protein [Sphingomonas lutea]|uniref:hypothetical protein n=1 Tax=Sphingomonas lutea TaxID=1045317 RepID=UPI001F2F1F4D|nr:hypothetical protein [Sphingomonas lutea]
MTVSKRDLIDAVGTALRRSTLRRNGRQAEREIVFAAWAGGLSVRSSNAAMDIAATGTWRSPIATSGAAVRRLAPALQGVEVTLSYCEGQLAFNTTRLSAREL